MGFTLTKQKLPLLFTVSPPMRSQCARGVPFRLSRVKTITVRRMIRINGRSCASKVRFNLSFVSRWIPRLMVFSSPQNRLISPIRHIPVTILTNSNGSDAFLPCHMRHYTPPGTWKVNVSWKPQKRRFPLSMTSDNLFPGILSLWRTSVARYVYNHLVSHFNGRFFVFVLVFFFLLLF